MTTAVRRHRVRPLGRELDGSQTSRRQLTPTNHLINEANVAHGGIA